MNSLFETIVAKAERIFAAPILLAAATLLPCGAAQAGAVIDFSKSTVATLPGCDECSQLVNIGFSVNFGGSFSQLYVNNNGVLSFTSALPAIDFNGSGIVNGPQTFPTTAKYGPLIAPFLADADTVTSGSVSIAQTTIEKCA